MKNTSLIAALVIISAGFIMIAIFGIFQQYSNEYEETEQELINAEYSRLMREYNTAVKIENEKTESDYTITLSHYMDYNNSVGNDWYYEFYINNHQIDPDETIVIHADFPSKFSASSYYCENDSYPDCGYSKGNYSPTKEQLLTGYTIKQETIVREDRGRYSGNTAKWVTEYKINAVMNYPPEPFKYDIVIDKKIVKENMWK